MQLQDARWSNGHITTYTRVRVTVNVGYTDQPSGLLQSYKAPSSSALQSRHPLAPSRACSPACLSQTTCHPSATHILLNAAS